MSKRSVFTTITPVPAGVSRETVIETFHTHTEMIDLNPLVIERHIIRPPAKATPEEYNCIWYEITDRISYLPGGMAQGKVTYQGCFHDLAIGLQTHVYAPAGLDIKSKWTVGGTLPGEPHEPVEINKGIPLSGLYIREDVEMVCSVFLITFVKKTFKRSHSALVARLAVRAQLEEKQKDMERMTNSSMNTARSHGSQSSSPRPPYSESARSSSHRNSVPVPQYGSPGSPAFQSSAIFSQQPGMYDDPHTHRGSRQSMPDRRYSTQSSNQNGAYGGPYGSPGQIADPAFQQANPYMQQQQQQYGLHPLQQQQSYANQQQELRQSYRRSELPSEGKNGCKMSSSQPIFEGAQHGRHPSEGSNFAVELPADVPVQGQNEAPPKVPAKALRRSLS